MAKFCYISTYHDVTIKDRKLIRQRLNESAS